MLEQSEAVDKILDMILEFIDDDSMTDEQTRLMIKITELLVKLFELQK